MADVTVIDPSTIATKTELDTSDTLLLVDESGKVKRTAVDTVHGPAVTDWDGGTVLVPSVQFEPSNIEALTGFSSGYVYVDENSYTIESGATFAFAQLNIAGGGKEYFIFQTDPTVSFGSFIIGGKIEDFLSNQALLTIDYSTADGEYAIGGDLVTTGVDGSPVVCVIDRPEGRISIEYFDDNGLPQSEIVFNGAIPDELIVAGQLAGAPPANPSVLTVDVSILDNTSIVPSDAEPASSAGGWLFPDGVGTNDLVRVSKQITLSDGTYMFPGDLGTVVTDGEELDVAPVVVNDTLKKPLYITKSIKVPTDFATFRAAVEDALRYYVPETKKYPVTARPHYVINIESGHTLDWDNDKPVFDGRSNYGHIRIVGKDVTIDSTNTTDSNRHFFTMPFSNNGGIAPASISGKWTLSGGGNKLGFIRSIGANVELFPIYGETHALMSIGFTQGSSFSKEGRATAAGTSRSFDFDEQLDPTTDMTNDGTEIVDCKDISGTIYAKSSVTLRSCYTSDLDVVICAPSASDEVIVLINQCEGSYTIDHYCGKVDFSCLDSGYITSYFLKRYINFYDASSNVDIIGAGAESDWDFTRLSLGGNSHVRYGSNKTDCPWLGTDYVQLIDVNCNKSDHLTIENFPIPTDPSSYSYVFNVGIDTFRRVDVISMPRLAALSSDELFGSYDIPYNTTLRYGRYFNIENNVRPTTVDVGNGDYINTDTIGKTAIITATGSIYPVALSMINKQEADLYEGMSVLARVTSAGCGLSGSATLNRIGFTGDLVADGVYQFTFSGEDTIDILKLN